MPNWVMVLFLVCQKIKTKKEDIMKKTLAVLTLIGAITISTQASQAFCWRNLNPANWRTCPKCEKVKNDCVCAKKKKCNPCEEKVNPCEKKVKPCEKQKEPCNPVMKEPLGEAAPCDPCDRLQNNMER